MQLRGAWRLGRDGRNCRLVLLTGIVRRTQMVLGRFLPPSRGCRGFRRGLGADFSPEFDQARRSADVPLSSARLSGRSRSCQFGSRYGGEV